MWEFVAMSAPSRADIGLIPPSSVPAGADDSGIKLISARDRADIATNSHRTLRFVEALGGPFRGPADAPGGPPSTAGEAPPTRNQAFLNMCGVLALAPQA